MRRTIEPPHLEQLEPRLLLSHSVLEAPVERAVFEGVVVDFAQYPLEPDHPAHSWSEWGKGLAASNGKIYTAIGDHNAPTTNGLYTPGNAYVYEFDPETMIIRCVADLNSGNPDFDPLTSWGNGKLHAKIHEGIDGKLYFGGYWGYDPQGQPGQNSQGDPVYYEGDYIYCFDPVTEEIGVMNYVPGEVTIPMRSMPSSGLYAPEMILYAEVTNGDGTTDRDFLVYDLNAAAEDAIVYLGDHDFQYDRALFVDANGDAWFNDGPAEDGTGTLRQWDLSEGAFGLRVSGMPGNQLRQTAGPDANGYLYGTLQDTGVLFRFDPATGEFKTILTLEKDTAAMEIDPSGKYIYYYPGSTSHYDNNPLIQVDITDIDNPVTWTVLELRDHLQSEYGYYAGGSYSMMINADGSVVYIEINSDWNYPPDHPAFVGVHIPSETLPAAPSDLLAEPISSRRIALTWTDNSDNEATFRIERSLDGVSDWTLAGIEVADATSFTDIGLEPLTTYYYRVQASNRIGGSEFSNIAMATTLEPTVPAAPSDLIANATSISEIDLAWTDNADDETGFVVEQLTAGLEDWVQIGTTDANVTVYSDTGLVEGVKYYYRVMATNAVGDSDPSNAVGATTYAILAELSENWDGNNGDDWPDQWTFEGNVSSAQYIDIQNNRGRVRGRYAASSGTVLAYGNTVNMENVNAEVVFSINSNAMGFGLFARRADDNPDTYYYTQVVRRNSASTALRIFASVDGVVTQVGVNTSARVTSSADHMMVFSCMTNADGTTDLKAKLWRASEPEPEAWTIETVDDTPALQGVSGRLGLRYALFRNRFTLTDDFFAFELGVPPDTTPPTVTVNPLKTADRTPELSGTIDDPTATVEVQVIMGGETYLALNDGITWVLPDNTIAPLANGVYDVMVTATDPANNVGYDLTTLELTIAASTLTGYVWEDFNDDAEINFGEAAIADVTVTLSDEDGSVIATTTSDENGYYVFDELWPGTYTMTETQPADYVDGQDALGTLGGDDTVNDAFTVTVDWGEVGMNYNYGERPQPGSTVESGQTATIGFWHNNNGQALIRSLNPENPTQLGDWLAATFPNMYGAAAGDYDLTGLDTDAVADFYIDLFKKVITPDANPVEVEAQAMAVAFAIYVTNQTLAGDTATAYGFDVTDYGVGIATWNVGSSGAAFGVEDDTEMTVLDIMLAADSYADGGYLYKDMGTLLRSLANEVFTAINEAGQI